jgi:hypothetical protein
LICLNRLPTRTVAGAVTVVSMQRFTHRNINRAFLTLALN